MLIRRSAPAQVWAPLEKRHAKSGFRQSAARGQTG
jgi:hypothetical protein